jgi:GcrA cell cycle regulator
MQASHCRAHRVARSACIRYLKRRWSKGASATRIARDIGGGISRNAVLGKIRRLGIIAARPDRRRSQSSTRSENRAASSHTIPDHLRATKPASQKLPTWIVDAESYADNKSCADNERYVDDLGIDADIPAAQRRSFLDLTSRTCRWPVGDPGACDFFFCGAPPLVGKPYCAEHCARAYRARDEALADGSRPRRAVPRDRCGAMITNVGDATAAPKSWRGEGR